MEVAVSVAEGSLGVVLEKLQVLAADCSRIKGLPRQVGFLQSELAAMQALLRKVSAMEDPFDVQVQAWAREVREMAYDVEDCVDAFSRQQRLASSRGGGVKEFLGKCGRLLHTLRTWRRFADQIDELKTRVVEVAQRRERYRLDDLAAAGGSSGNLGVDPRLVALFADEDQLVGVEGPRDELARWLLEESGSAKHRKVLSVVGFGGLGKTTLANQVYRKIGGEFHCRAFVSVSQKPNLKQILKDCLLQLCLDDDRKFEDDIGEWDEKNIITKMRGYLADKRGFQCLKEFKLYRGIGYLDFETGATPKLEKLKMPLCVSMAKGHGFIIGLEHLPCLKYVMVHLCNEGATSFEIDAVEAAIRIEAIANPNHPMVTIGYKQR